MAAPGGSHWETVWCVQVVRVEQNCGGQRSQPGFHGGCIGGPCSLCKRNSLVQCHAGFTRRIPSTPQITGHWPSLGFVLLPAAATALVETFTAQIDNFILPIVHFSCTALLLSSQYAW